jgi:L-ascorbate metabolism protein UlaG (beta-lactamase superfamily)
VFATFERQPSDMALQAFFRSFRLHQRRSFGDARASTEATMAIQQRSQIESNRAHAGDTLTFIGNATVLLRYGDLTILTDPSFIHRGEQVPLGYGMSTERLTDPAMDIADLPPLDLIVLSHYHGDHVDQVAEAELDRAIPIITVPDAATTLASRGFTETRPLETWESFEHVKGDTQIRVTAMPGRHAPGALTVGLPPVMGSVIELSRHSDGRGAGRPSVRLYITGDTVMYEGLEEIPKRYPEIDLALLHLGGTRVLGLTVTMDAEQGVELLRTVQPKLAVPIHYNDYEAFKSPLQDFIDAVAEAGLDDRVRYLLHGEALELAEVA